MLIIWKFPKSIAGLKKRRDAARVFEIPALQPSQYSDKKVAVSQIVFGVGKVKP